MTDPARRVRFVPDPCRPYLARARIGRSEGPLFLKRYDLGAWCGTQVWRDRLEARCALIERVTSGRTRFRLDGDRLTRTSDPTPGMRPVAVSNPLSRSAFSALWERLDRYHQTGAVHGDLTRRNVVTDGADADLIDWEPILVGPGPRPATDPAPERVTDPTRWLGGCDLLRYAPPDALVSRLDLIGINRLRGRA